MGPSPFDKRYARAIALSERTSQSRGKLKSGNSTTHNNNVELRLGVPLRGRFTERNVGLRDVNKTSFVHASPAMRRLTSRLLTAQFPL
jgi:hypothetical protein